MVTARLTASTLILTLIASCGKGKAEPVPGDTTQPAKVAATATSALPAETRVIMGVSVPRLTASPVALRLLGEILGRDADARQRLTDLLAACKIDPARDLETVTIAMAEAPDIAVLARGKLDEKTLVACVRTAVTASGGALTDKLEGGHAVYAATAKDATQKVWFAFAADRTLVVGLSEGWLVKVLDPATPRIDARPDTVALLKRVPAEVAFWGVGYLPAGVGGELVKLAQIGAPASSVAFDASFDGGLNASLRMDLKSATDAEKLTAFAKSQLDWLAVAAQRLTLGRLVAKIQIAADGASVKLSVKLDDADVKTLEAALAKGGSTNDKNDRDKKEQQQ